MFVIKNGAYSTEMKEYLLAADLRHWIASQGNTPEIDSILNELKDEYDRSIYVNSAQETYDEHMEFSPGTIAPDFGGRTLDGKEVSLKEFRGKVVYIIYGQPGADHAFNKYPTHKNYMLCLEDSE